MQSRRRFFRRMARLGRPRLHYPSNLAGTEVLQRLILVRPMQRPSLNERTYTRMTMTPGSFN